MIFIQKVTNGKVQIRICDDQKLVSGGNPWTTNPWFPDYVSVAALTARLPVRMRGADWHYGSGRGTHRALSLVFVSPRLDSKVPNVSGCERNPPRAGSAPHRDPEPGTPLCVCPPCGGPELRGGLGWVRGSAEGTGCQRRRRRLAAVSLG